MLSSETVWLRRWQGDSPRGHLDPNDYPTLNAVKEKWVQVEREMRLFIGRQTDQNLQQDISYSNFASQTFRASTDVMHTQPRDASPRRTGCNVRIDAHHPSRRGSDTVLP
jgi:hypothetical protein